MLQATGAKWPASFHFLGLECTINSIRTGKGGSFFLDLRKCTIPCRLFCFSLLNLISWARLTDTLWRIENKSWSGWPPFRTMLTGWISFWGTDTDCFWFDTSPLNTFSLVKYPFHIIREALYRVFHSGPNIIQINFDQLHYQ